jgi:hypothetical protein
MAKCQAGIDEVKNSAGMNHALETSASSNPVVVLKA